MVKYFLKSPFWLQYLWKSCTWRLPSPKKAIYLTFDDGPTPEITNWVIDLLCKENIFATFFLIGDKIEKFPEVFQMLKNSNHSIGNHTFNHLVGWKTINKDYFDNIDLCQTYTNTNLFRPPHGRIKPSQVRKLKQKGYKIIMWDVLSGDFDIELDSQFLLEKLKKNTRNGSIVVFHDSEKAWGHLKSLLPLYLSWLKAEGYKFKTL